MRRIMERLARASLRLAASVFLAALAAAEPASASPTEEAQARSPVYATAKDYVVTFYPLWFTYYQSRISSHNRLVGPARISPLYQVVVAINDDTLYASTFLDLAAQPVILTVPKTDVTFSVLTLDPFGNIYDSGIQTKQPGKYGLTGPGFKGVLPNGVTPIALPLDTMVLIFRVDKHAADGEAQEKKADLFRRSLRIQELCAYQNTVCPDGDDYDRTGGYTLILPVAAFGAPFKTVADALLREAPLDFLRELQTAVASSNTPPLSAADRELSKRFDQMFRNGRISQHQKEDFAAGARAAHRAILTNYFNAAGPTNWIHFRNIGDWGRRVLDRASITEFIQFGNGISTAAYYHAFEDRGGQALDGTDPRGYTLTFSKRQIPDAERFWSITAYTPESVELVRNPEKKYLVASYTPGLRYDLDGALTIYMSRTLPPGVPEANWLPVPEGPFNVMLRVYGPEGNVARGDYAPPGIARRR